MEPDVSTGSPDEGDAPNNALLIEDEGAATATADDHDDLGGATESDERFARKNGWVEKDKWKGDADDWVDAKNFADRGRGVNAIMRKNNERLERELAEIKQMVREQATGATQRQVREFEGTVAQLEAQRDQAVEQGDTATFRRLDKALRDAEKARPQVRPQQPDPQLLQTAQQWKAENPWFEVDDEKTAAFNAASAIVFKRRPELRGSIEFLRETERVARKVSPAYFEDEPVAQRPAPVNRTTGGRPAPQGRGQSREKGWDDLPREAQEMGQKFINKTNGKVKDKNDYAKQYFIEQEEERQRRENA
jgi:hypothetical protein